MLKRDPSKLEARIDVCLFVGYPKGTKCYIFYDHQEQMVLVSTNIHFLEADYMIDNKPRSKIILKELRGEGDTGPVPKTQVTPSRIASTQERGEPHHSGRVVCLPERFIGLGEISIELETNPSNYNQIIQDKDVTSWKKAMNTEMKSMYSNRYGLL